MSFDTETEKLIEAEVTKRTQSRVRLLAACVILCVCSGALSVFTTHHTRERFLQTVAAKQLLDKKNQEADETFTRLEARTKELDELAQRLQVAREKITDQATDLDAQTDELKKLLSVKSLNCKQSLAIVQRTRAECDKKKSDAESLNAQAKANQQQASELIERCVDVSDKKFAECKKICESVNLPPFWPQRLHINHPSLITRDEGVFYSFIF